MSFEEIEIEDIEAVFIDSELISSGGGTYYRNKINFMLKLAEELSPAEVQNFTTELHGQGKKWHVRLMKGAPEKHSFIQGQSSRHLVLEEQVDMSMEDFSKMHYEFPLADGQAEVSFEIHGGKVHPHIRHH
jgi:hypothetical protein